MLFERAKSTIFKFIDILSYIYKVLAIYLDITLYI